MRIGDYVGDYLTTELSQYVSKVRDLETRHPSQMEALARKVNWKIARQIGLELGLVNTRDQTECRNGLEISVLNLMEYMGAVRPDRSILYDDQGNLRLRMIQELTAGTYVVCHLREIMSKGRD